ncbi:MAG: helix-turn-helix domain-containing protein [Woeseia sp.]
MHQSYAITPVAPRERFDYFANLVDEVFCPMRCEPRCAPEKFTARLERTDLGSVSLARVSTSPITVTRRFTDVARIADPPYLVKFQLRGESRWSQRGREVHLRPGDFVIASTAEPYRLEFIGPYDMPVLAVPGPVMRELTRDPEQFLGWRMPAEDASCGLLSSFVAEVVSRLARLPAPMAERVETNILDLLGGVLKAHDAGATARSRGEQIRQIKRFVARVLRDRNLGPAMVAHAFGVSTRYVHKLFAGEALTLNRYIRAERLIACRRMLADPAFAKLSITEIALHWGFYDLPHMSRCFRESFGVAPKEFRSGPG